MMHGGRLRAKPLVEVLRVLLGVVEATPCSHRLIVVRSDGPIAARAILRNGLVAAPTASEVNNLLEDSCFRFSAEDCPDQPAAASVRPTELELAVVRPDFVGLAVRCQQKVRGLGARMAGGMDLTVVVDNCEELLFCCVHFRLPLFLRFRPSKAL